MIRSTLFLLLLIINSSVVSSEEWKGCGLKSDPDMPLRIGTQSVVCLTLAPGGDWEDSTVVPARRYAFKAKTDDYSHLAIPGSYDYLVNNDEQLEADDITIHVNSQKGLSFLRKYYDRKLDRIYPYLTAIIDVKDGVVKGIAWDNACIFCGSSRCIENTYNFNGEQSELDEPTKGCYLERKECTDEKEGSNEKDEFNKCDISVYVVWTGTDLNRDVMKSSNSRFSAFSNSQVTRLLKNALARVSF